MRPAVAQVTATSIAVARQARSPSEVRCHRCSHYLGESEEPIEIVGIVKETALREAVIGPRLSWRCKCGWTNIFRRLAERAA